MLETSGNYKPWHQRLVFFWYFIVLLFILLLSRLIYLQIVKGESFLNLSENNRIRVSFLKAPRGKILDQNGIVLASNRPQYQVVLDNEQQDIVEPLLNFISGLSGENPEDLLQAYQRNQRLTNVYERRIVYQDFPEDLLPALLAKRYKFPGLEIAVQPVRNYIVGPEFAHILGYVREISAEQLNQPDFQNYRSGDLIGQNGLEKEYEKVLQGQAGDERVVVNVKGHKIRTANVNKPVPGNNLQLTIRKDLQEKAYEALGSYSGAAVVLNPNNGEVLALVSKPAYNPDLFNRKLSLQQWQSLLNDPLKPLQNRAVSGRYPPGSIFKIFMSMAGLLEKKINATHTVYCPGHFSITRKAVFHCHKRSGHGHMSLVPALEQSCNVYFYALGQDLGIDLIHQHALTFGFEQKTGIELPNEVQGLIPSREWKKNNFRNKSDQIWYPGETPSVVIGQGAINVSVLQVARALGMLVNDGSLYRLTVIKNQHADKRLIKKIDFPQYEKNLVLNGLKAVVNNQRGTGRAANLAKYGITVAGKTATAQVKSSHLLEGKDEENHAWFASFAPFDKPEVVVVVLAEHGGHGGATAAPVVGEILKTYFNITED